MDRLAKYEESFIFILVFTLYCGITCIESNAQILSVELKFFYICIYLCNHRYIQICIYTFENSFLMSEIFVSLSLLVLHSVIVTVALCHIEFSQIHLAEYHVGI